MRKLTIVFHHAGGGHRNAAEALRSTLTAQNHAWDVELLDIQQLLDQLDLMLRFTGVRIQDIYNQILRRGCERAEGDLGAWLHRGGRLDTASAEAHIGELSDLKVLIVSGPKLDGQEAADTGMASLFGISQRRRNWLGVDDCVWCLNQHRFGWNVPCIHLQFVHFQFIHGLYAPDLRIIDMSRDSLCGSSRERQPALA